MTTCQFDVLYILLKYFRFSIAITIYNDIETTSGIDFFLLYIITRLHIYIYIFYISLILTLSFIHARVFYSFKKFYTMSHFLCISSMHEIFHLNKFEEKSIDFN